MDEIAYDIVYGPTLASKRVTSSGRNGEVRIIVPADPDKLRALREIREHKKKRRVNAGLIPENNSTWGKR